MLLSDEPARAQDTDHDAPSTGNRLVAVAGALLVGVAGALAGVVMGSSSAASVCGPGGQVLDLRDGPVVCTHTDEAPPGVVVTEHVSTAELKEREGAADAAYQAAEELGVPGYYASNATSPAVPCDGDGTSGYRVQAMYVVEAGRTNRFSALQSSFKLWAAGVDDVVNRSAALTGGVRHLRYVTEPDGSGGCTAKVLNVTVPAGSMSSFQATINAVQALGYTSPARKYAMWTDDTTLCGVATTYPYDTDGQGNPNNGSYVQYARIDSGCWGFGNGGNAHSTEAHEIVHMLGSVMPTAPHATSNGHCWDESDTMCYADGGGKAMVQVCDPSQEYLLDCRSDDYFSTYPAAGSWLDTHWNAADSQFLIGGGDGSNSGTTGSPTVLGATLAVNNPAIPGLPTQAEVSPLLPSGRTLTSVAWRSARSDCAFTQPTELVTDVVCNATSATATTVTATLTDSSGATKSVTSPLTFTTASPRDVTLGLAVDSQDAADSATATVCTATPFPVALTAVDTATGVPVKGLTLSATKQADGTTTAASVGAKASDATGTSLLTASVTTGTTLSARSTAVGAWRAGSAVSMKALPAKCAVSLTVDATPTTLYYGDKVTASGALTRGAGGTTIPVSGASVTLKVVKPGGTSVALGTARTAADGTFSGAFKATASGQVVASVAGTTGFTAATADGPTLTVQVPETDLAASVDKLDVGYGDAVTATGTLRRDAGGTVTPLASATVTLTVTVPGRTPVTVGSGRTLADGSFTVKGALRASGTLRLVYAGVTGQPGASVELGQATAGTWTTAVSLSSSASSVTLGTTITLSGSVSKSYDGTTRPAGALKVKVWSTPTGGTPVLVGTATSTTAGTWSLRVTPRSSGSWKAVVPTVAGYAGSESRSLSVRRR
jgi:hypothetical protein